MRAWIALFSAIACEVTGTVALGVFGLHTPWLAVAVTGSSVVLSYVLLSLAFRRIPVAVAFAVWEAVGLVLITGLGVGLLGDRLSPVQGLALVGLLIGARLLHGGTRTRDEPAGGTV